MKRQTEEYDIFTYDRRSIKEIWTDVAKSHYYSLTEALSPDRYNYYNSA